MAAHNAEGSPPFPRPQRLPQRPPPHRRTPARILFDLHQITQVDLPGSENSRPSIRCTRASQRSRLRTALAWYNCTCAAAYPTRRARRQPW